MIELSIFLGVLFFFLCICASAVHSLRKNRMTLLSWAVLGMGGVYGLGWALVVFVTMDGGNPSWDRWLRTIPHLYPVHTFGSLILLCSTYFGWLSLGSFNFRHRLPPIPTKRTEARLKQSMWVLLVFAFITQWLYTRPYGGFLGLLEYSASIRAAIFVIDNPLSFLKPFGELALISSCGFFGLWLKGSGRLNRIGLAVAFLFSLYLLFSWRGRIGFMVYLATFILGATLSRKPRPLPLLLSGFATMTFIIVGAYYVSSWLNIKPADSLVSFVAHEISFPFGSFFAQLDSGEHMFRGFKDILVAPVYLFPTSWWSTWGIEDVSQINTAVIMGVPKGVQGSTVSVPVDLLTLGIMQASLAGIAVVGSLFGVLLRLIQNILDKISNHGVRAMFEAYVVLQIVLLGIFYAQPALFVARSFGLLIATFIIALFLRVPRLRLATKRSRYDRERLSDHSVLGPTGASE